jgi:hypothetical protein
MEKAVYVRILEFLSYFRTSDLELLLCVIIHLGKEKIYKSFEAFHRLEEVPCANLFLYDQLD